MEDRQKLFTAQKKREEEFAARRTLIRRLIIWAVVIVVVVGIYFGIAPLNRAITLTYTSGSAAAPFAMVTDGDLEVVNGGTVQKKPLGLSGADKGEVLAAQNGDRLAVAVKGAMTVKIFAPKSETTASVPQQFGDQDQIVRLSAAPGGFYAVVQDMSDTSAVRATNRPTRTLLVTGEDSVTIAYEDGMIVSSVDGQQSVTRDKAGQFSMIAGPDKKPLTKLEGAMMWDFDFDHDVLAAADEATLHIVQGGRSHAFVPAFFHKIIDVKVVPESQQVWVSLVKPGGSAVLAFEYGGRFVGYQAVRKGSIRVPHLQANDALKALVQAESGT